MDKSIGFIFDESKATQAASYILSLNGGRMNYMKLIKLLYLSDREAISKWQNTITTDTHVSMPFGPVTSNILNKIRYSSKEDSDDEWSRYIRNTGEYEVRLVATPEYDLLSRREMRALREINDRFGSYSEWDMVEYCHENIPEWEDPHGSSIPIAITDILAQTVPGDLVDDCVADMQESAIAQRQCYVMRGAM